MNDESAGPVATLDDIPEHGSARAMVGKTPILLTRRGDEVRALSATCPHGGASLAFGCTCGERVICPLHLAAFDRSSGRVLEPPGHSAVEAWGVRVVGRDVFVERPDSERDGDRAQVRSPPPPAKAADPRTFIVIGSGAAGAMAVEALRDEGFGGRLVLLAEESGLPFERPHLNKSYLAGQKSRAAITLRDEAYYASRGIELMLGVKVDAVDWEARELRLSRGATLSYDAALLATGGTPRWLSVPGADSLHVHSMRTLADANRLAASLAVSSSVALIGSGFLNLELAAVLRRMKMAVTIIAPETLPLARIVGDRIGRFFLDLHERNGVTWKLGCSVASIERGGKTPCSHLDGVKLEDGEIINADRIVLSIGVVPATDILGEAPFVDPGGGVIVDREMRAAPGLWAAGDIAVVPWREDRPRRIEHWRVAQQQARVAARSMVGEDVVYDAIPFFWTQQHTALFQMVGTSFGWDDIVYSTARGEVEPASARDSLEPLPPRGFLAVYLRDDRVIGAAGIGRSQEIVAVHELLRLRQLPTARDVRAGVDWITLLHSTC